MFPLTVPARAYATTRGGEARQLARVSGCMRPSKLRLSERTETTMTSDKKKNGTVLDFGMTVCKTSEETMSHPVYEGKPNASHMCARISLHTYD